MSTWKFAVACPIRNHKFRFGKSVTTTFTNDSENTDLDAVIKVVDTSPSLENILQADDVVTLGASSQSGYVGNTEQLQVSSVSVAGSVATITFTENCSNEYAEGDKLICFGTRLAGNYSLTGTGKRYARTIKPPGGGKLTRYAQVIYGDGEDGSSGGIYYPFASNPFFPSAYYRFGLRYKVDFQDYSGDSKIYLGVSDGVSEFLGRTVTTSDQLTFTDYLSSSGITAAKNALLSGGNGSFTVYLMLYPYMMTGYDSGEMTLAEVFIEHIAGVEEELTVQRAYQTSDASVSIVAYGDSSDFTVGTNVAIVTDDDNYTGVISGIYGNSLVIQLDDPQTVSVAQGDKVILKTDGYLEFTEYPLASSLDYGIIEDRKTILLADTLPVEIYQTAEPDAFDRFYVRAHFSNVPNSLWTKFKRLLDWQKRGHLINLHTDWVDLPLCMTGKVTISNLTKRELWDLTYRSFDFEFEETLL